MFWYVFKTAGESFDYVPKPVYMSAVVDNYDVPLFIILLFNLKILTTKGHTM